MAQYITVTDDKLEHEQYLKGLHCLLALWDIDQYLRGQLKYSQLDDKAYEATDKTRQELRNIMEGYNIDLDVLLA